MDSNEIDVGLLLRSVVLKGCWRHDAFVVGTSEVYVELVGHRYCDVVLVDVLAERKYPGGSEVWEV